MPSQNAYASGSNTQVARSIQVAQQVPTGQLSVVPPYIDQKLAERARSTPAYLLTNCRELGITGQTLAELASLRKDYRTNMSALFELSGIGLNVDEIDAVLAARAEFRSRRTY